MLRKLLKHDFKAFLRIMPFYLVLLVLAVVAGLNQDLVMELNGDTLLGIWALALVAVFTVNIVIVIQRFRDNLIKDEGYLMFTLPVSRWQLLLSKALTALASFVMSGLVVTFSALILINAFSDWPGFAAGLIEMLPLAYAKTNITAILCVALVALITVFQHICLIYTALVGSQILPRFRTLAAFGIYFLVMYVESQIIQAVMSCFPQETYGMLLGLGAIEAVFAGLYFWLCGWLLQHTLNLE